MAYERFTAKAKNAMKLAHGEAMRLNHEYIGVEHLLLGLIRESGGMAAGVLERRLTGEEVIEAGKNAASLFERFMTNIIERINE